MEENSYSKQKSAAHTFFAKGKIQTPPRENFKEELKEKLFQQYINSYQNSNMEETKQHSFWQKKKTAWLASGAFALILVVLIPAAILLSPNLKNKILNKDLGAELAYLEGSVEYKDQTSGWLQANKELSIKEGYSIRILGEGKAIVNLDDGSAIRLNNDSAVTFSSMDPENIIITNDSGEVYARVVKADRDFKVVAGEITYHSLGTAYKTINTDIKQGVEVYQSTVRVLGVNESGEILVEQGNQYYVINKDKTTLEKKVTAVDPETIKKDEFTMWNKTQDESTKEFKSALGIFLDLNAPTLNITNPKDGDKTQSEKVTVTGNTEAGVKVTVNDKETQNNNGTFSYELALNIGANTVKVIALDASGNKTVKTFTVTREAVAQQTQTQEQTPTTTTETASISLGGHSPNPGKITVNWVPVGNFDMSKGFKVVYSTSPSPVYPGNDYQYLSDPNARNATWSVSAGTYYVRVCQYLGGACGIYSNEMVITVAAEAPADPVTSISLSGTDANISWITTGYSSNGFKVVWSKNSGATYPGRNGDDTYHYYSEPSRNSDTIDAFKGPGTYYVRVCEYLGGSCGLYSNEITVNL